MVQFHTSPPSSNFCGHCCLAMLTNTPMVEVLQLVGHIRRTTTRELSGHLRTLGYVCGDRLTPHYGNMSRIPATCLVKAVPIVFTLSRYWHWLCRIDNVWYDPSLHGPGNYSVTLRVVSYLEVTRPPLARRKINAKT